MTSRAYPFVLARFSVTGCLVFFALAGACAVSPEPRPTDASDKILGGLVFEEDHPCADIATNHLQQAYDMAVNALQSADFASKLAEQTLIPYRNDPMNTREVVGDYEVETITSVEQLHARRDRDKRWAIGDYNEEEMTTYREGLLSALAMPVSLRVECHDRLTTQNTRGQARVRNRHERALELHNPEVIEILESYAEEEDLISLAGTMAHEVAHQWGYSQPETDEDGNFRGGDYNIAMVSAPYVTGKALISTLAAQLESRSRRSASGERAEAK